MSQAREVSQSTTFSAGINFEIFSTSTELTFEESITDTKEEKWTLPAGHSGRVAYTPTLKCTKGKLDCGDKPKGDACTGLGKRMRLRALTRVLRRLRWMSGDCDLGFEQWIGRALTCLGFWRWLRSGLGVMVYIHTVIGISTS